MTSALILVDLQYDFMPTGALPVAQGDRVVPIANALAASTRFHRVIATQDWHPGDHGSFASNQPGHAAGDVITLDGLTQVLWPDHCVQHTRGAALVDELDTQHIDRVFQKGTDPHIDSYSGFFDNGHRRSTGLSAYLKSEGIERVFVMGLATDYCVKFTALDALGEGFETTLIQDACRGVDLNPGDVDAAIVHLQERGVRLCTSQDLLGG